METCIISANYNVPEQHIRGVLYNYGKIYDSKTIKCEYIKYGYVE